MIIEGLNELIYFNHNIILNTIYYILILKIFDVGIYVSYIDIFKILN